MLFIVAMRLYIIFTIPPCDSKSYSDQDHAKDSWLLYQFLLSHSPCNLWQWIIWQDTDFFECMLLSFFCHSKCTHNCLWCFPHYGNAGWEHRVFISCLSHSHNDAIKMSLVNCSSEQHIPKGCHQAVQMLIVHYIRSNTFDLLSTGSSSSRKNSLSANMYSLSISRQKHNNYNISWSQLMNRWLPYNKRKIEQLNNTTIWQHDKKHEYIGYHRKKDKVTWK